MFSAFVDILTKILEEHGFNAFLVVLTLGFVFYYSRYIIKRMETLHDAEVTRLIDERNLLLEHILKERRSSKGMDAVIEKLEDSSETGGDHE